MLTAAALAITAAAQADWSACIDATCRITAADGGRGTGCAFARTNGQVFVLTAGHVVGDRRDVQCEFWQQGHQSSPFAGRVVARAQPALADAAIVAVAESAFAGRLPPLVPVAPPQRIVRPGETLTSVGCAAGAWSTGWKGHALGYSADDLFFLPPPQQGRSGSALFDASAESIIGVVRARTVENPTGIAVSLQALYAGFTRAAAERAAQCPPGGCPPGGGLLGGGQRLWPRGGNSPQLGGGPSPSAGPTVPWPTLPQGPSGADLGETNRRLDHITALLERLAPQGADRPSSPAPASPSAPTVPSAPATPAAPAPSPSPTESRLAAVEHDTQAQGRNLAAVQREQGKLRDGLGQLNGVVQQLTGDVSTLPERVQARIDKVKAEGAEGTREIARAYARDFVQEKLADGSAAWTLGKLLGTALGLSGPMALALGGGLWLVARRLGAAKQT